MHKISPIRIARKKMRLTQAELGDRIGVHETTIRRWESGKGGGPSVSDVVKLCEVLGCSEAELLNGPGEEAWVLEIKIAKNRGEVIDMSETMGCVASVNCTRNGAVLELGAGYDVFQDDAKFEDFVEQLRQARGLVLRNGEELGKIRN